MDKRIAQQVKYKVCLMNRSEYSPLNFCGLRFSPKYWLNYLRTAEETYLELLEFLTLLLKGKRH